MYLQEFTLFDFDLDFRIKVEVTLNVAQYSIHYATYALAKFEVATLNGLGGGGWTYARTDRQTSYRLWYENSIPLSHAQFRRCNASSLHFLL